MEIFPASEYKHRTRIGLSPLHGPWPDERNPFCDKRSFAQFALKAAIPANLASRGMVDWETGGQSEVVEEDKLDKFYQINARLRRQDQRERGETWKPAPRRWVGRLKRPRLPRQLWVLRRRKTQGARRPQTT